MKYLLLKSTISSLVTFFWLQMLVFVKNRNKTEPLELVPWKSTNNLNQGNEDFQVPLKATTITVVFLLLFCVFFIVIFISDELWHSLTAMVIVIGITSPIDLYSETKRTKEIKICSASKNSSVSWKIVKSPSIPWKYKF